MKKSQLKQLIRNLLKEEMSGMKPKMKGNNKTTNVDGDGNIIESTKKFHLVSPLMVLK